MVFMTETKITVIMAVYNAEPYLRRCLDSIQAQTLKDFDVILVDDGSTDGSLDIANEYAQHDKRFRVYHKENGGGSSARQYAIERLAEHGGKYSIHVDPDDWVVPQMLEQLYKKAEETGADMVICDFYQNTAHEQWLKRQNPKSENPQRVLEALFCGLHGSLCNKLIRSLCYKEANIEFPKGLNYCEDFYVNVCMLQKSVLKVDYLPEAFYHYDYCSNCHAETRNYDGPHVDFTRTEIVKRCREAVPNNMKRWQFHYFEMRNAFGIIRDGSMEDGKFKSFFSSIPISLLLHHCCWRPYVLLTLFVVHTPLCIRQVRSLFHAYSKLVRAEYPL